jgi:hypothetical protein
LPGRVDGWEKGWPLGEEGPRREAGDELPAGLSGPPKGGRCREGPRREAGDELGGGLSGPPEGGTLPGRPPPGGGGALERIFWGVAGCPR